MAGLLGLAVAVCDDEGTVTQPPPVVNVAPPNVEVNVPPTPPAPPVVAPLTAMITPASSEVSIGGMVDFAVGTSGGSGDASWTCTSSDAAVATVEKTDTGCRATAVAGGGATITAAVTKGSETTNVAATLTVSTTADAFLIVTNVSGDNDSAGNPTDESGLKGSVDVTIQVERGNQTFERLALNVDGMEVASQGFGTAAAAEDAEQNALTFTLSFDSDAYYEHGDHTDVAYMNGEHSIQAMLKIAGRDELLMSNILPVEFDNDDGYVVTADLGENTALDGDGRVWYGGPDNGHIVISALSVRYSGTEMGAVAIVLGGCKAEEYEGDDNGNGDDHGHGHAGAAFEFDCTGQMADREITVTEGGENAMILNDEDLPTANIDMMGPMAPAFMPNPNKREEGWVNASVDFTGEHNSTSNKDGWLDYDETNADDGVGGYTPQLRIAPSGSTNKVGGALAGPAYTEVPASLLGVLLAGEYSSEKDEYCVVVSATDKLGNESDLPAATADCVSAGDYEADDDGDYPAGLLAGVDLQVPTIKFSPASPKANDTSLKEFQVQAADEGSGIRTETESVVAEASRRDAKETKKLSDLVVDISLPLATTSGIESGVGYYTFTAHTVDKAGNASEKITRTALHDDERPMGGLIVGAFDDKTGRYSLTATVTDDLSIKDYWAETTFGDLTFGALTITGGPFLDRAGGMMVDAYNAVDLTQSRLASSYMVHTYRFLQTGATAATPLTGIRVVARDHGTNADTASHTFDPALTAPTTVAEGLLDLSPDPLTSTVDTASVDQPFPAAAYTVFDSMSVAAATKSGGTVELMATASGPLFVKPTIATPDDTTTADTNEQTLTDATEGLRDNPLTRVDFYAVVAAAGGAGDDALKFIGSVSGGSAGAEDYDIDGVGDTDGNDRRRYIYQLQMNKADFLAKVGAKEDYGATPTGGGTAGTIEAGEGAIIAFGVRDNKGVAVQLGSDDLVVEK